MNSCSAVRGLQLGGDVVGGLAGDPLAEADRRAAGDAERQRGQLGGAGHAPLRDVAHGRARHSVPRRSRAGRPHRSTAASSRADRAVDGRSGACATQSQSGCSRPGCAGAAASPGRCSSSVPSTRGRVGRRRGRPAPGPRPARRSTVASATSDGRRRAAAVTASWTASAGQAGSRSRRCRSAQRRQLVSPGSTSGPTTPWPAPTCTSRCAAPRACSAVAALAVDRRVDGEHDQVGPVAERRRRDVGLGRGPAAPRPRPRAKRRPSSAGGEPAGHRLVQPRPAPTSTQRAPGRPRPRRAARADVRPDRGRRRWTATAPCRRAPSSSAAPVAVPGGAARPARRPAAGCGGRRPVAPSRGARPAEAARACGAVQQAAALGQLVAGAGAARAGSSVPVGAGAGQPADRTGADAVDDDRRGRPARAGAARGRAPEQPGGRAAASRSATAVRSSARWHDRPTLPAGYPQPPAAESHRSRLVRQPVTLERECPRPVDDRCGRPWRPSRDATPVDDAVDERRGAAVPSAATAGEAVDSVDGAVRQRARVPAAERPAAGRPPGRGPAQRPAPAHGVGLPRRRPHRRADPGPVHRGRGGASGSAEMVARLDPERAPAGAAGRRRRAGRAGPRELSAALPRRPGGARPSVRWVASMRTRWASCTPADRTIRLSEPAADMPRWVRRLRAGARAGAPARARPRPATSGRWSQRYPRTERARGYLDGVSAAAEPRHRRRPGRRPRPTTDADVGLSCRRPTLAAGVVGVRSGRCPCRPASVRSSSAAAVARAVRSSRVVGA